MKNYTWSSEKPCSIPGSNTAACPKISNALAPN